MNGCTKRLGVISALAAVLAFVLAPQAGATFNPKANVTLDCRGDRVVAEFHYSGFNPANRFLDATQRLEGKTKTYRLDLDGEGDDTDTMSAAISGRLATASTVVVSASGRVKARATAEIRCSTPPPPSVVDPRAHFEGPCGDPMYRAILNNNRSDERVRFRVRYRDGGAWQARSWSVARHDRKVTPYFHVDGLTRMTIRAGGEVIASERSAPGGNYRPCR